MEEPLRLNLSHAMRKHTFFICKNKGADQLRKKRAADHFCAADQHLCFPYIDKTFYTS